MSRRFTQNSLRSVGILILIALAPVECKALPPLFEDTKNDEPDPWSSVALTMPAACGAIPELAALDPAHQPRAFVPPCSPPTCEGCCPGGIEGCPAMVTCEGIAIAWENAKDWAAETTENPKIIGVTGLSSLALLLYKAGFALVEVMPSLMCGGNSKVATMRALNCMDSPFDIECEARNLVDKVICTQGAEVTGVQESIKFAEEGCYNGLAYVCLARVIAGWWDGVKKVYKIFTGTWDGEIPDVYSWAKGCINAFGMPKGDGWDARSVIVHSPSGPPQPPNALRISP